FPQHPSNGTRIGSRLTSRPPPPEQAVEVSPIVAHCADLFRAGRERTFRFRVNPLRVRELGIRTPVCETNKRNWTMNDTEPGPPSRSTTHRSAERLPAIFSRTHARNCLITAFSSIFSR